MEHSLLIYREFYEAATEGNISRAAKKLNMSQPAVSKALSRLEKELGTRLFTRTSRGVHLTPAGELLYGYLHSAFDYIEKGEQELQTFTGADHGYIRIGGSTSMCKYVLIPYVKEYLRVRPFSKISILNHTSGETLQDVLSANIDIGAVALDRLPKGIEFIKLMDVEDILVSTAEYMRYVDECFGPDCDIFKVANFMVLTGENETRRHLEAYMKANGLRMTRKLEIASMDLIIEFARVNVGIAVVEREFVSEELKNGILEQIPLKIPIPKRQVGFIYMRTNSNPELKEFLKCVE